MSNTRIIEIPATMQTGKGKNHAIVCVEAGNLPFGSGSDFFGIIQLLCFKAALLFFFLGADATVGSHA